VAADGPRALVQQPLRASRQAAVTLQAKGGFVAVFAPAPAR
jgi:hypothetical protein